MPPGTVTIGDGNAFAGSTYYIEDLSSQNFDLSGYTSTTFGGFNAATTTVTSGNLSTFFGIEDKILDYLDYPASGYVRIKSGYDFVAHSSEADTPDAIQRAITVANDNDIIEIQAGTYVGGAYVDAAADSGSGVTAGIYVDKPVTLLGPNPTFDPNSNATPANAQAIIEPDYSDPNPFDHDYSVVIDVLSSNVTIQGLTVQGSNPNISHSGGVTLGVVPIDAAEGIVSYEGVGNITVESNLIDYTAYTGVDFYNYVNGAAATTNNVITDNLIENLSDVYGFGIGVLLYNNFYAEVTDNVIQNVRVGVQTGNFSKANPGGEGTASISNNVIAAEAAVFSTT